jgi:hypothetical protein
MENHRTHSATPPEGCHVARTTSPNDMLAAMSSLLRLVHDWWTTHPGWTTFIYAVITFWASLYTDRARRIVAAPIRLPALHLARFMERDLDNQISVLKYMHTDTFHLVHYLAYYVLHSLFFVIRWGLVFGVIELIIAHGHPMLSGAGFFAALFGGLVARLMRLQHTLGYLFDYDKSMAELEALRNKYPRLPAS